MGQIQKVKYSIYSLVLTWVGILLVSTSLYAGNITTTINIGDYRIIQNGEYDKIEIDNCGILAESGKPILPAKNVMVALPPGARVNSVDVIGIGRTELPGTYKIVPTSPLLPMIAETNAGFIEKINDEWSRTYQSTYSSDEAYPAVYGELSGSGALRKYAYASVTVFPMVYHPQSGRLEYYSSFNVNVNYDTPSPGSAESSETQHLLNDRVADARAAELFINYDQIKYLYEPIDPVPLTVNDYVIITSGNLANAIEASEFIDWKTSLGFSVRTVFISDPEIAGQYGNDLPEKIRNFLMEYYIDWGIEYVLIVGDHDTVPMRYCYPDPQNHANGAGNPSNWPWAGDVPTDYYYADLSSIDILSWDSDCDGYHGEYGEDNPDLMAEVSVGRIPTSNEGRITYTLNKLVNYEQDTGDWKNNFLNAGAIAYYENDDNRGIPLLDGAANLYHIEQDFMHDYNVGTHFSERDGLAPSEHAWNWLSESGFLGAWRNGRYGVVNWYGHGWSDQVARRVWAWDDGDGIPESGEMTWPGMISLNSSLQDDYPSMVIAFSCLVGYPEPNPFGNLGIDLLTEPGFGASVGMINGTRVMYVARNEIEPFTYEFNHFLLDGPSGPEPIGQALYDSKFYIRQNYVWNHYAVYWDLFGYMLYGDPSLRREGAEMTGIADNEPVIPGDVSLYQNYPNPFNAATMIEYSLPEQTDVNVKIYNIRGQEVAALFSGNQQAGSHTITWNAESYPSGIYFAKLEAGRQNENLKLVLLK